MTMARAGDRGTARTSTGLGQDEAYLDTPYLSIRWRSIPQILYAEWKGFAASSEFRSALMTGVRAIRERHVSGYVSDARKAKVMLPEDEVWAREVWLPQAVAAGLKRMANVTAPSGLSKMAFDDAATDMDSHGLSMRIFHHARPSGFGPGVQNRDATTTRPAEKEMTPTDRLFGSGSSLATRSDSVERVPRGQNEH